MRQFQTHGQPFYGSAFEHTVTPGRTVEGEIVCAETGAALVGFQVAMTVFELSAGSSWTTSVAHPTNATTDANGYFRVEGLPPNRKCFLNITPPDDQPYLSAKHLELPESDELLAKMDFKLRPGVFVRGRVSEAANGKPVQAQVRYFPYKSNENAEDYHRYSTGRNMLYPQFTRPSTGEDGEYRIVVIPGRGILTAIAKNSKRWRTGFGAEAITGFRQGHFSFDTYDQCSPEYANALAEIDIEDGVVEFSHDLQVDRGTNVRLQPVDQKGRLLGNVEVLYGASTFSGDKVVQSAGRSRYLHYGLKKNFASFFISASKVWDAL